jgi:hypothetical protein
MKILLAAAAVSALALAGSVHAAELIGNGDFEAGFTDWSPSGNVAVLTAADYVPCCGTTGTEPNFSNNHFVSFGSGNLAGVDLVSQTFADVLGALYTVRYDLGAFGAGDNTVIANAGATTLTATVSANNNADTTFHNFSFQFVGTGADAVKFTVNAQAGDNTDALLDNVSVSGPGVPEPATWAMMLTGFFGLGAMIRRRRMAVA